MDEPLADRPSGRRRPLSSLLGGIAVSQVGNMALAVAIPWFVFDTTGSAARTGLASAALAAGSVLPPALAGPLIDRIGFKATSVISDGIAAASAMAIPLLHLSGLLEFWHVLLFVFLLSSFNAIGDSGRFALLPGLAEIAAMPAERANSAERSVVRFGQFAGPVLGGTLITLIGAANVLFLDSATFIISAILVAVGVPKPSPQVEEKPRRYLADLLEGFRFVKRNRLVFSMILIVAWGNFLLMPLFLVILPVYAQTFWGDAAILGAVIGTFGVGAFAGTLLYGAVGEGWPRRATFLVGFIVAPFIGYGALAATPPLPIVFVAAALAGLIAGPINPIFLTVIQEATPASILGRTFGVVNALSYVGIPVGAVLAGYAVEAADVVVTVLVMGISYVAVTMSMVFNPALRNMDDTRPMALNRGSNA